LYDPDVMDTQRLPQPVHDVDRASPAPGDLDLVRRFLSLHDHAAGTIANLEPEPATLGWWLRIEGLVAADASLAQEELVWVEGVRRDLVTKVRENMGEPRDLDAIERLNRAATDAGLRMCFGCAEGDRIHVDASGVRGAVGRLLGIAFLAELDGSWHRFRRCADPECTVVFYDRSRNHTAKWCSMQTCGNRNKVREFRRRSRKDET
jgi:predicted RNA-binding Zn ribbon-like protein